MPSTTKAILFGYIFLGLLKMYRKMENLTIANIVMHIKQNLRFMLGIKSIPIYLNEHTFQPCVLISGIHQKKFRKNEVEAAILIFSLL